jgi:hypothetical protein
MSAYLSLAPIIERTAAENTSAFPEAPQVITEAAPSRPRFAMAALLRRAASLELALAARLERRPSGRRLAAA